MRRWILFFIFLYAISRIAFSAPEGVSPDLSRFSWHDWSGQDWMSPVREQGSCGACWVFGAVAAVEAQVNIVMDDPDVDMDLSEQTVLSCGTGSCDGWAPESTMGYISNYGIPAESCYPYLAAAGSCEDVCLDSFLSSVYIRAWGWEPDFGDRDRAIKERLMAGPVVTSIISYPDLREYTGGVYEHTWGESTGGHVIALVGWDDANDSWICKNSWGADWGMGGYFEIKRGECMIGLDIVWVEVDDTLLPYEEADEEPDLSPDSWAEPAESFDCGCSVVW